MSTVGSAIKILLHYKFHTTLTNSNAQALLVTPCPIFLVANSSKCFPFLSEALLHCHFESQLATLHGRDRHGQCSRC